MKTFFPKQSPFISHNISMVGTARYLDVHFIIMTAVILEIYNQHICNNSV